MCKKSIASSSRQRLSAALAALSLSCVSLADAPKLPGFHVLKPPVIDGVIQAAEWAEVPSASGSIDSQTGEKAPEPLQFWLAYDANFVYFAARLSDHEPKSIHAMQYQTNVGLAGDDSVELDLDLGGSLSGFNSFRVNPRGATSIALSGGRAVKREWTGDFVAAARITTDGWEAEARIPWQLMPLPSAGVRDVRFNVSRFFARMQREYSFVYTGAGHSQDTPYWQGIPIPKTLQERTLKLLPYGYVGYDSKVKGSTVFNSGLDMKTELTDKINFVGSINPDFRNIENQILSIDFSRFERLAGESRPFFQEGRQYISSALFASQRIKRFDVGVNTYGRIGDKMSFGVIDTLGIRKENDFVTSFTYAPTPNDNIRGTVTSLLRDGVDNSAYLARYSKQIGPYNVFLRTMGSKDKLLGGGQNEDATFSYSMHEWNASLGYDWVSPNFRPRLGFFPEVDYKGPSYFVGYDKPWKHGALAEFQINVTGLDYTHVHGDPYRRNLDFGGQVALRNGISANFDTFRERFEGEDDHTYTLGLTYPRDNLYRNVSLQYQWGELALVPYTNLAASLAYRFNQQFQTNLSYQKVKHGESEDQLVFTASYDLGHNRTVSGRIVKQNNATNGFVSFSRSGNRGAEYYLIIGDPNADKFRTSVILKVVIPFELPLGSRHRAHIKPT
jgi:hypothetical protein